MLMRHVAKVVFVAAIVLFPAVAMAQSLTGVVRDGSGAVLPGVTVEAASPALIEKVRSVVSDGSGQYRLENLAPGAYSVTYTLPGFTTVKRDGVQISTGVTVTLNTDLRVSGVEETITVTGETPVVDVQNSTRVQRVLSDEIVSALPASRGYGNLLATVSGIQSNGTANSGTNPDMIFFTSRGGRSNEGTVQIDGMNVGSAFNGGGVAGYGYDTAGAQEVQVTVSGGLGEADRGGPAFNLIPKTGGNTFSGTYFGNIAGEWSQSDNVDDSLRAIGIPSATKIIRAWDTSVSLGGPIMKDRVWFYATTRTFGNYTDIAGRFGNLNAGNPNRWDYIADPSITQRSAQSRKIFGARVTSQLTPKNKVSGYYDYQRVCEGGAYEKGAEGCRDRGDDYVNMGGFGVWSPESTHTRKTPEHIMQFSYTAPVSNQLLVEAAFSQFYSDWGGQTPGGALDKEPFIPVQEVSIAGGVPVPNMLYHGFAGLANNHQSHNTWRASASYVTGAHSLKAGYAAAYEVTDIFENRPSHGLQYRFNGGRPDQITQRVGKWQFANRTRFDAFYVQDQWTVNRLTLQGALRYERAWSFAPEGMNGLLEPSRFGGEARTQPRRDNVTGYNDIAPRMGLAYDVFGNGKTAIKANLSKYWQYAANDGVYINANPAVTFTQAPTRSWTDNGNFIPDCNLDSPLAQNNLATGGDSCGALSNQNFFAFRDTGSVTSTATRLDPALLSGWNVRPFDWQFSLGVQQELLPRVSAEVSYSRRSWGGFTYVDNEAVTAADYDNYTITVPSHPDLPTSGQQLTYKLLKPEAFGRVNNFQTLAENFGDVDFRWQGVELNVNARMSNGLTLQGGFTSGAGYRNQCEVWEKLPELTTALGVVSPTQACEIEEPYLWAWRGLANYTVPKVDVQISAILRSQDNVTATNDPGSNGLSLGAQYFETAANVQAQLGRGIAGGGQTVTLDLAPLGEVYPDRLNTVDMRFSKIIRIGRTRSNVGIDLYNLFNSNTGTGFNQVFGANGATWLRPNAILNPRYVRFNATIDF
jgi:hypothetical protein